MFSPTVDARCSVTKQPCSLYKLQSVQQKWLARLLQTLLQHSPSKCTRFQMYNWPKERLHYVALHSMETQTGLVKVYACCWCLFENSRSFRGSVLMTAAGNVFRFCRASGMTLSVVQTRLVEAVFNLGFLWNAAEWCSTWNLCMRSSCSSLLRLILFCSRLRSLCSLRLTSWEKRALGAGPWWCKKVTLLFVIGKAM